MEYGLFYNFCVRENFVFVTDAFFALSSSKIIKKSQPLKITQYQNCCKRIY